MPLTGRRYVNAARRTSAVAAITTITGLALVPLAPGASAIGVAPLTSFTPGDPVVYRVGTGATLSSAATAVSLDEYSPTGTLLGSVAMPTAAASPNLPFSASGTANSEGLMTLSQNGQYLVAPGYDAAPGTSGVSGNKASVTPRVVALVSQGTSSVTVNTATALTDESDQNNIRSAASVDGSAVWAAGANKNSSSPAEPRYTAVSTTGTPGTSTPVVAATGSTTNLRQIEVVGNQLYASADPTQNKNSPELGIATIGSSGPPTSGSNTVTNLNFQSGAAPSEPYGFTFLTLGTGDSVSDTLYVADNQTGTATTGQVEKFGLISGTWTAEGSVSVPTVTGITANDTDGIVTIYATASGAAGTGGTLYSITDSSGLDGTLTGTASVIAAAPTGEAFRGVAFAPGTTIGSGGAPPPPSQPTISVANGGLPAALSDSTNATDAITVGDTDDTVDPSSIVVTASSSNTSVASNDGIVITGTGANRTLSVTPSGVGYSTITLTATDPANSQTATATVDYGASDYQGDPSDRYYSGSGNASTAIDVGDGYAILGDDENNVLRLYNLSQSGPPVKTFDFTGADGLPYGSTEIDIESSARSGDTLYWLGSQTDNSSGDQEPARTTLFSATITGSGASTSLTYNGAYTGLQADLLSWDAANGNPLGLSNTVGKENHDPAGMNIEGLEFAQGSSTTAYLSFRAPLEPLTASGPGNDALVIPLTDINTLPGTSGIGAATFGAPMEWDLGGLGIREICKNADGQYFVIAGTANGDNDSFGLYQWDGNPADAPQLTQTALPVVPASPNQGAWENIVSVPDPLTAGSTFELIEDNGDTAWYGDGVDSKDGLPLDLQKDLGRTFTYEPPVSTTPPTKHVAADFDGDGPSDFAVFRPSNGSWHINGQSTVSLGKSGDIPVAGDYDGDGKTDEAVFRPSNSTWYVKPSSGGTVTATSFGITGDIPVPGDYNRDGKTDIAVFRASNGTWHIQGQPTVTLGKTGDIPVPGDYDGDGKTDPAVFRPSNDTWYYRSSLTGTIVAVTFGASGDIPVPGDYNGDGTTDIAVYRPSNGTWHIKGQSTVTYGSAGDVPVAGDYAGDGTTEPALFRPSNNTWHIKGQTLVTFGTAGDIPAIVPPGVYLQFFAS